jgi:hypothetical protein
MENSMTTYNTIKAITRTGFNPAGTIVAVWGNKPFHTAGDERGIGGDAL